MNVLIAISESSRPTFSINLRKNILSTYSIPTISVIEYSKFPFHLNLCGNLPIEFEFHLESQPLGKFYYLAIISLEEDEDSSLLWCICAFDEQGTFVPHSSGFVDAEDVYANFEYEINHTTLLTL